LAVDVRLVFLARFVLRVGADELKAQLGIVWKASFSAQLSMQVMESCKLTTAATERGELVINGVRKGVERMDPGAHTEGARGALFDIEPGDSDGRH
jgi:hypothetical protein